MARPDAQALDELRNHLEHKYAKIVDSCYWIGEPSGLWSDHLAFVLDRDDLYAKSLLMLKLSRAALIYLCLAMHFEESQHKPEGPVGGGGQSRTTRAASKPEAGGDCTVI